MDFLKLELLGNTSLQWLAALGVLLVVVFALSLLRRSLRGYLGRLIAHIPGQVDDILVDTIAATKHWFFWAVGVNAASRALTLPSAYRDPLQLLTLSLAFVQAGLWACSAVRRLVEVWNAREAGQGAQATVGAAIRFVANLLIWTIVLLLVLQNLGVKVGALVAGLGVGGVAAALALQAVLGDLFASLSIYIDRPFDLGDFIVVGDYMGTVQRVGLRTTRLTSLGGEHIVLPNADLTSSRIRNYRRMEERRVLATVGVTYDTPSHLLRQIPQFIEQAVRSAHGSRFDRAHFAGFGDFALNFEYVYYVLSADYNRYMDVQQAINLEIVARFERARVAFAFPTQTLEVRFADPRRDTRHANDEHKRLNGA